MIILNRLVLFRTLRCCLKREVREEIDLVETEEITKKHDKGSKGGSSKKESFKKKRIKL